MKFFPLTLLALLLLSAPLFGQETRLGTFGQSTPFEWNTLSGTKPRISLDPLIRSDGLIGAEAALARTLEANKPAQLTIDGLGAMLESLGYQPEKIQVPGAETVTAYKLTLQHGGMRRTHYLGIDPVARNIVIVGAVHEMAYSPEQVGPEHLRRMLNATHQMGPSYIFLNDNRALGLATPFGNVEVTNDYLRSRLDRHVELFDTVYLPLMREISQSQETAARR